MGSRRTAVITGGTSGIGEAIATRLAASMTVIIVGRSDERLSQARQRIRDATPDTDVRAERVDLAELADVRALANRLADDPPDVVISNAATIPHANDVRTGALPRAVTTNHLAPYLLLRSLVAPIDERPARFVVVGADPSMLRLAPVDLDDVTCVTGRGLGPVPSFRPFVAYGRTKNMNAMFVYALAGRLAGSKITVNGAHPGIIPGTGLSRNGRGAMRAFDMLLRANPVRTKVDAGADTPVWLATSPEVDNVNGRFFVHRKEVRTAEHTTDRARCDRLWDISADLVGLPRAL
ncbi:MAG: SDR family NAD(P)-dependent oxidoreductase [Sciscionella sp.]|nr:SDR family NAD(P)-dependent oxidoreductase [Sciscionella sp.]